MSGTTIFPLILHLLDRYSRMKNTQGFPNAFNKVWPVGFDQALTWFCCFLVP